jgi:hypothetical protein
VKIFGLDFGKNFKEPIEHVKNQDKETMKEFEIHIALKVILSKKARVQRLYELILHF